MPERTDISPRGLAIGAGVIVAGIALSLGAAALMVGAVKVPATGASRGEPPPIEGARLQTAPPQDLATLRREKQARLSGYGRVDEGHVHIPIERAMRILAKGRER